MVKKISLRNVAECVANLEEFNCNGTLRGEKTRDGWSHSFSGRLPEPFRGMLNEDEGNIAYVICSYATPIAWILKDGTVRNPAVKYSVTTSRHQGKVNAGIAEYMRKRV